MNWVLLSRTSNAATIRGEGIEVTFKQIAGLLARRIVFKSQRGRYPGARATGWAHQVWIASTRLPAEAEIRVKVAEHVKGGSSVLAVMPGSHRP